MNTTDLETERTKIRRKLLTSKRVWCPVCQYSLHRVESDRCPECGAQLDLRVGVDEHFAPWVTAIVGCSMSLGFMVPFLFPSNIKPIFLLVHIFTALIIVFTIYLIITRRIFIMEPEKQWRTAIGLICLSIAVSMVNFVIKVLMKG